jgi:hypothetical protein
MPFLALKSQTLPRAAGHRLADGSKPVLRYQRACLHSRPVIALQMGPARTPLPPALLWDVCPGCDTFFFCFKIRVMNFFYDYLYLPPIFTTHFFAPIINGLGPGLGLANRNDNPVYRFRLAKPIMNR